MSPEMPSRRLLRNRTGFRDDSSLRVFQLITQGVHLALELVYLPLQRLGPWSAPGGGPGAAEAGVVRVAAELLGFPHPVNKTHVSL